MSDPQPDAYALLESSFQAAPHLRAHKPLPRRADDSHSFLPAAAPLKEAVAYPDDDTDSHISSQNPTPLASPAALNGADSGLPPTPPSNSQDEIHSSSPPPHADGVVASLTTRKSLTTTPINQRSPPTPDPSPPRTTESMTVLDRPILFAYPSSRAESFTTAREDPFSSDGGDSRASTPLGNRLSTVEEDRSLGLAFERDDNDITPTNEAPAKEVESSRADGQGPLINNTVPDRWDPNLMKNVTVRKKRNPKPSPQKNPDSNGPVSPATGSPRRRSSLRERVEASKKSPQTKSIETFAQSIGWPTDPENKEEKGELQRDADTNSNRLSTSTMSSAVVEAMVIVTPPQRRRTLRHSGKNLAYRTESDSPINGSPSCSHRNSMQSEDIPLHKLVHKRATISDRGKRISSDSATLGYDRYSSPLSIRKRGEDTAAITLAHQESVRRILQPAAEILSRSNSVRSPSSSERGHKRVASAPSPGPQQRFETSTPNSFRRNTSAQSQSPLARSPEETPMSPRIRMLRGSAKRSQSPAGIGKPDCGSPVHVPQEINENHTIQKRPPPAIMDRVRVLLAEREAKVQTGNSDPVVEDPMEPSRLRTNSGDSVPTVRRGSASTRGRSEERRRSSHSQDRTSTSQDALQRPSLDRVPTEEIPRRSHEWSGLHPDDHRRVSFDRSTTRTEEHAMARHLFAQTTPFSQFSDTPIEVSEATAVSIYPHNNHSLLVVQQVSRGSTQFPEPRQLAGEAHLSPESQLSDPPPTPPFVDAVEGPLEAQPQPQLQSESQLQPQPTLTVEPSTPPMQISLPVPEAVDSPLKNPRKPPEPPSFKIIPPTPADELERQLMPGPPGPPKRSDSHPQRRLSLVQRARRYSDNLITPLLSRASISHRRHASESHAASGGRTSPRIPTVNDEDGSLHPFWRPRGFWDGFEDSDSESEDDVLPQGGDTSDVEPEPESPPKVQRRKGPGGLTRKLTNGFKAPTGFLIGNSLGVERSGTNRRTPRITLPSMQRNRSTPKILIQPPTFASMRGGRVEKRIAPPTLRSSSSFERRRSFEGKRRSKWRKGRQIPGLKGVHVQYIGLSGVRERLQERRARHVEREAEVRRERLRKSIGPRYYVDVGGNGV
ncbi:hypothetical protein BS50DRAFT_206088 [Corynespora cassiicola Philippines]|uniref:Uncharacterized protein n=1 Tax=Corynespora cassiicola Philippines TaxID=1448308 RepID=A0A2T2N5G1_CORCC|nr:hypothetical protein BS50DRAFT_206088 [Corynespora cassiicola Philippines]